MKDIRCVAPSGDRLGEGPCWSAREGRLYWFDIKSRRLRWLEAASGETGVFDLPMRASAAAPRTAGGLLMATELGLAVIDTKTGRVEVIQPIQLEPGFRTNDGKIDPAGNFWWSTMDDNEGERPGAVFRTSPALVTEKVLDGVHIPNTISVSADGNLLYLADSRLGAMVVYDTDGLARLGEFCNTHGQDAAPDGSAIDAEGHIWNAHWGGARIVRYAPDGNIERIVAVPVDQPTSCAFGGPDLTTLYVTSAWDGLAPGARARQPLAGGLFAFEPGVKGLALPEFAG